MSVHIAVVLLLMLLLLFEAQIRPCRGWWEVAQVAPSIPVKKSQVPVYPRLLTFHLHSSAPKLSLSSSVSSKYLQRPQLEECRSPAWMQ